MPVNRIPFWTCGARSYELACLAPTGCTCLISAQNSIGPSLATIPRGASARTKGKRRSKHLSIKRGSTQHHSGFSMGKLSLDISTLTHFLARYMGFGKPRSFEVCQKKRPPHNIRVCYMSYEFWFSPRHGVLNCTINDKKKEILSW
jgi:hypothetical protein